MVGLIKINTVLFTVIFTALQLISIYSSPPNNEKKDNSKNNIKQFVTPTNKYDYRTLQKDINTIQKLNLKDVKISTLGRSVLGRNLYLIRIGNGPKKLMITGATHGREYITALLAMRTAQELINDNLEKKHDDISVYIIPMVNPDGVDFALHGVPKDIKNYGRLAKINGSKNFSRWKFNANGNDINDNFNADLKVKLKESEPETRIIGNLFRNIKTNILLNYHCVGERIYSSGLLKYKSICAFGKELQNLTGYKFGVYYVNKNGFTDYACRYGKGKILAYTIEFGHGSAPVPWNQYKAMWNKCCLILNHSLDSLSK